jgi:ABC-type nitrate/sulfonate/bicarbonate transport system permease component
MTLSPTARDRLIGLASPIFLLLAWEGFGQLGWIDQRFFPAPSRIAMSFARLSSSGELWTNLAASLMRLFWGYLLGGSRPCCLGWRWGSTARCAP